MSQYALANFAVIAASRGRWMIYSRDGVDSIPIVMVPGKSDFVFNDTGGGTIEASSADWTVRAGDLIVGAGLIVPRQGDQISGVVQGVTLTFELMTPPYRSADHLGTLLRIHTKLVASA